MKADNPHHLARRDTQIDMFVAEGCILEVNDEPVAKSVEYDLVEILMLDFPVPVHARRKLLPLGSGNVQSGGVVVGIVGPPLI